MTSGPVSQAKLPMRAEREPFPSTLDHDWDVPAFQRKQR